MSEQALRKLSFAQIATRAAKKEQEENDNKRKEERAAEEAEQGSNNSRKDDWRRKQRWDETEPKMGGERTRAGRRMTEFQKPIRFENRELTPGSIFIAEHYEEAADRLDKRPTGRRRSRGYSAATERWELEEQQLSCEEIEEADAVDGFGVTTCKSHTPIVIKGRKFIVLFVHFYHYVCIPLYTYNRRGAQGRIDESHHVSVFDCRFPSLSQQAQSQWTSLQTARMKAAAYRMSLNAAARITCPVSRPKNLPIEVLGHLDPESTERLKHLFVVLNDLAATTQEKQKLEAKHRDPTWTLAAARDEGKPPSGPATAPSSVGLIPSSSPWTSKPVRGRRASHQRHHEFPPGKEWPAYGRHPYGRKSSEQAPDWTSIGADRAAAAAAAEDKAKRSKEGQDEDDEDAEGSDGTGSGDQTMAEAPAAPPSPDKINRPWGILKRLSRPFRGLHAEAAKPAPWHSSAGKKRKVDDEAYDQPAEQLRRSGRKRTKAERYAD
jgi:hypothetical protein